MEWRASGISFRSSCSGSHRSIPILYIWNRVTDQVPADIDPLKNFGSEGRQAQALTSNETIDEEDWNGRHDRKKTAPNGVRFLTELTRNHGALTPIQQMAQ